MYELLAYLTAIKEKSICGAEKIKTSVFIKLDILTSISGCPAT